MASPPPQPSPAPQGRGSPSVLPSHRGKVEVAEKHAASRVRRRMRLMCVWFATVVALLCSDVATADQNELVIGSKRFTESYILGEILLATARSSGVQAQHKQGLGNTGILFEALKSGSIDLYPDYTGTIGRELLKSDASDLESLNRGLAPLGLGVAVPLGFENTYALAMPDSEGAAAQPAHDRRSGEASGAALRLVARVPQSQRRLAGIAADLCAAAVAERPRSRARLRGARRRTDRCDGHLLDRRQDREVQAARAAGRQALLPRVRRGAGVSARRAEAVSRRRGRRSRNCRAGSRRRRWCR